MLYNKIPDLSIYLDEQWQNKHEDIASCLLSFPLWNQLFDHNKSEQ